MTLELLFTTFQMSEGLIWKICNYKDDSVLSVGNGVPVYLLEKPVAYATAASQEKGTYTEITCFIEP